FRSARRQAVSIFAAVFHDRQRLAFDELAHGVDAAQGEDGVAHGGFDQHGQVAPGRHLQHDAADGYTQDFLGLILHGQALEAFRGGTDEVHHEAEFHFAAHRGFAEDGADIEQPQAAYLEQAQQQLGATAFDDAGSDAREFDRIVGHKAVPARDEFERQCAFAQPGFTGNEHAHAQYAEKDAMHERFGCEALAEVDAQQVDELGRIDVRAEQGYGIGFAEVAQPVGCLQAFGNEDGGHAAGLEFFEQTQAPLRIEIGVVSEFFGAEHLNARGVNEVEVTDEVGPGTPEVVGYGLRCRLFAGNPLEVDAFRIVGN